MMRQLYYAIQTIVRGRDAAFIKVISLTLGLLVSIVLFARIAFEMSYDTFYHEADRLFVVQTAWGDEKGMGEASPYVIYPTASVIAAHFPDEVESATVINDMAPSAVMHGVEKHEGSILLADSLYFPTMGIRLVEGNATDLALPHAIFLSQSFARRVFGGESPVGKSLVYPYWGKDCTVMVKGVFADIPENVSFGQVDAVASIGVQALAGRARGMTWTGGGNYRSFVRLRHPDAAGVVNQSINALIADKYFPSEYYGKSGVSGIEVSLTPLSDYHLQDKDILRMVRIMALLGFALLLTATLNYALISISSLPYRAKAVGVHKCSGADAMGIFGMFLWETALIVQVSLILVVFIILNFAEQIEDLMQTSISALFAWQNLWLPSLVVLFLFVVGGALPGVSFSSVSVMQVFRRYTEDKKRWKLPLLFFQFGGAAFLLGVMCIVFVQYRYLISKDLGYDTERTVYVYHHFTHTDNALANLRHLPYVESAAVSGSSMLDSRSPYSVNDASGNYLFAPRVNWFDKDFGAFIGMQLEAGRFPQKEDEIAVNEEFVRRMGWTGSGVGEYVPEHGTVIGILTGYSFADTSEMPPFEVRYWDSSTRGTCVHVRLKAPFDDNLYRLNAQMKQLYPQDEIIFRSYASTLKGLFRSTRIFRDATFIACIAILAITLMGLIGYANDEVRRRSKEIAIRKINGAELPAILRLLLRDVTFISLPAIVVGTLSAVYVGAVWQTQFRDPLVVSPWLYAGAALVVLVFILCTVVMKSWRIANENPVHSIKSE